MNVRTGERGARVRRTLPAQAIARDAARRRDWLGGFNLLPYRQREARLARRRWVAEIAGAAGVGFVCAALGGGMQRVEQMRLDEQRDAIEARLAAWAPRLRAIEAAAQELDARRANERASAERTRPLGRMLALLDVLRALDYRAVMLLALRHAGDHAELEARASDPAVARRWVDALRQRKPGWRIEMSSIEAAADAPRAAAAPTGAAIRSRAAALRFAVRIRWPEPAAPARAARIGLAAATGGRG